MLRRAVPRSCVLVLALTFMSVTCSRNGFAATDESIRCEAGEASATPSASSVDAAAVPSTRDPAEIAGDPPLPGVARVDPKLVTTLAEADAKTRAAGGAHDSDAEPRYINRLALESSPYLLQHAHNPVNWYSWGDEAFERARREHKPVLLSIGYSTCHWCHVMEHESFENEEIARVLNEHFIAVKVDREERPDIDAVYMNAVQLLTGGGGWPMTLALTPERTPFFAATYIPAHDGERGARKGFLTILREIADAYAGDPDGATATAAELSRRIAEESRPRASAEVPRADAIRRAVVIFRAAYDPVNGGFGRAPKFPQPSIYDLLLHYYRRTNDEQVLAMVTRSLERMTAGGIYDHVGGGFHRYSTDAQWLVPHFEKMLYDNAQLANVYLDAFQVTGRSDFGETARETLEYLAREMSAPEGGFYSATDADSRFLTGEMKEGCYFTWTPAEIEQAVGPEQAPLVNRFFGVSETGNFDGRTILHTDRSIGDLASTLVLDPARVRSDIAAARTALYDARLRRSPPFRDDKIVAAWNGLAISAFARGAFVLDEERYALRARSAAELVLTRMRTPDGTLSRSYRAGRASQPATLDDYAFMIQGLLDLYESVWEPRWLRAALELQLVLDTRYFDPSVGAYFTTSHDGEALLARPIPADDGAEPSGNSVAAMNLLRLSELTDDQTHRARAETILRAFGISLATGSPAAPKLLSALDFYLDEPVEIVIVAAPRDVATRDAMLARARAIYVPNRMFIVIDPTNSGGEQTLVPLASEKRALGGRTTAYVCRKRVCDLPTSDPDRFAHQLRTVAPLGDGPPQPPLAHGTPHT